MVGLPMGRLQDHHRLNLEFFEARFFLSAIDENHLHHACYLRLDGRELEL